MADYPYDDDVRDYLARLLYRALPAFYRAEDEASGDEHDLEHTLAILAAPLAVIRQNIEELHADLFIDTASDEAIPLLAEMVGTTLLFPDAESNRRDVRGTIAWRRRKGTAATLQAIGTELTGDLVVTQEGWKLVQVTQDLDILRRERTLPDLRSRVIAERVTGPLDASFHCLHLRHIGARTGRYHPRHVTHWFHPTVQAPLSEVTAVEESLPGSDIRYAMHPLGERHPLRARRTHADDPLRTDRVPEQHMAAEPAAWFGPEGRFLIRICGLPAAAATTTAVERVAALQPADLALARGAVSLEVNEQDGRRWRGIVRIELGVAPVTRSGGQWTPDLGGFVPRVALDLDRAGGSAVGAGGALPAGAETVLLRLSPTGGAAGRLFAGAALTITGGEPAARAAAPDPVLAREGFLLGALHVRLPALEVMGERWLHLAADGSVYEAMDAGSPGSPAAMPTADGARLLARRTLLAAGPGPAWPPALARSEPTMLTRLPAAPGRGPAVLHGGRPLRRVGPDLVTVPPGTRCALVFAARTEVPGGAAYRPFQRLFWTGEDAMGAVWAALDQSGMPVSAAAAAVDSVFHEVAATAEEMGERSGLALRFECDVADAILSPAEVAWSSADGATVLIHLPQLVADAPPGADWPGPLARASEPVRVARDGSTWAGDALALTRAALDDVVPFAAPVALRRRRVAWRRLCAWDSEDWAASPPAVLAFTEPGRLDVDPAHGLFAMAAEEPPQQWAPDAAGRTAPSVTSDMEDGATMHIGARPMAREPVLDLRLPRPTRLVSRSGRLRDNAPADWFTIPRYPTLTDALAAIDAEWHALTADLVASSPPVEVVEFQDSATYAAETPAWPRAPADAAARDASRLHLTIQAAERERPVVLLEPTAGFTLAAPAPDYATLTLRGLALGGHGWSGAVLPPAGEVRLEFCTILFGDNRLSFGGGTGDSNVVVTRSELAGVAVSGPGRLEATATIIDAGDEPAIEAPDAVVSLDRVSVGGRVQVRVLDATDCLFRDRIEVADRFHGCVRYSRVASNSVLPRIHRIAVDTPLRVVATNRHDPAFWRLRADSAPAVRRGAENGSEMGAFNETRLAERTEAFARRLVEFTPGGLVSGIVRVD